MKLPSKPWQRNQGRTSQRESSRVCLAAIPIGRYGRQEKYAAAVAFLSSARASYITGSVVRVDDGYIQNV